ncbi:hypothetical protein MA16_Dca009839 [Dendrobium catenatum]|uniref:Reverse transcriptase zinc-binding domain-containing protein n=1 Tax=Dendrobium catenatum TaxID=906689 RepID=A0A2I0XIC1_9ASPA|nr:hypothetical protein MA16_Dca009839 [Dendrobium catenatum]
MLDFNWNSNLSVGNFILDFGWNLPEFFPGHVKASICKSLIVENGPVLIWDSVSTDKPSNKIFSDYLHYNLEDVNWFKYIWHKGFALRYASYSWMAIKQILKMADILNIRGIPVNPNCSFCLGNSETHSHVYFECDYSFSLLIALFPVMVKFYLRPNLVQTYDFFESHRNYSRAEKNFCYLTVAVLVYHLWRERNNRRFSNAWRSPDELKRVIILAIVAKARNWRHYDMFKANFKELLG